MKKTPMRYLHLPTQSEALVLLNKIGVDSYGIDAMLPKMSGVNVLLEGIASKVANIIKQEMLSVGGDAAVSRGSVDCSVQKTDAILMGSRKQILRFAEKIRAQPFGLSDISTDIVRLLANISRETFILRTRKREMSLGGRSWIMGILNVTPDSFSDGGRFQTCEEAIAWGVRMVEDGADIVDIGGESSRPGAEPISIEEEMDRVIPVIRGVVQRVDVPISVDTTRAEVAAEAMANGAEIINDISAMTFDDRMAQVVSESKAAIVLMHMRGTPRDMQKVDMTYQSVTGDIIGFLQRRMEAAVSSGIEEERIIIDPGIGFGKTQQDNLKLIKHLSEFKLLGRPIVTGVSRKSFIGNLTGDIPAERTAGTAAAVAASILNGSHVIRVHDVKYMKKVASVTDAIARA